MLQVGYVQVDALMEGVQAGGEVLVAEADHGDVRECVAFSKKQEVLHGYTLVGRGGGGLLRGGGTQLLLFHDLKYS